MNSKGFTLLEMLLAVGLSCVLLFGLMRAFMGLTGYLEAMRALAATQRMVGLAFYQLRTDLSAAFVPEIIYKDESKEGKEKRKAAEASMTKDKLAAEENAAYKPYFLLAIDEHQDAIKVEGVRRYPLKQLSFVTTNPLHVYAQKQQRLVRVVYELVRDKARSRQEREVFLLVRKEVTDVTNTSAKEDFKGSESEPVRSYVIATNVRGVFVECAAFYNDAPLKDSLPNKQETEKKIAEGELVTAVATTWGDKPPLQGMVPQCVTCWLWLWEGDLHRATFYSQLIPIGSYPSQRVASAQQQPKAVPQPGAQAGAQQVQQGVVSPAGELQGVDDAATA